MRQNLETLMSTAELAAYLDLPVATLYGWRYRGEGPRGVRVGRHIRYRETEVARWLADREKSAP